MRVAIATCAEFASLEEDDRLLLEALPEAEPAVWDDPAVAWDGFDLVLIRSTWDYTYRRDEFVAWVERLGDRVLNPPDVIRWNTDKRYLRDLAAVGVPVVPTTFVEPGQPLQLVAGPCVVKPTVSAGSRDTARHEGSETDLASAAAHVARLHAAGRTAMVQPYLHEVDDEGETALLYFDGSFSHAIRKGAMLRHGEAAVDGLFAPEEIEPRRPREAEREVADLVMTRVADRFGEAPLYARVDLIGDVPLVLELELTEPSLFFAHADGAAQRFAGAVRRRAARSRAEASPSA